MTIGPATMGTMATGAAAIGKSRASAFGRTALRTVTVAALVSAVALWGVPPAHADITIPAPAAFADAIKPAGTTTTGATLDAPASGDPTPTPNGVSSTAMAGFPTDGNTFAILTTGDVNFAPQAPPSTHDGFGADISGDNERGDTDFDVSILKIDFTVAEGMNCLRFDFRFFTEEYDEAFNPDWKYNDAFIAELDDSTWDTADSVITAPNNFAFDPANKPITVNATGGSSMTDGPADTTYDGATAVLTAATTVTTGPHSLYLSIFDQGDHIYDSAVFVDNLVVGHATNAAQCAPGAKPKLFNLSLSPAVQTNPVGTPHTVTAKLSDIVPVLKQADETILFSVSGANTASGEKQTDESGVATFTYTGTKAGTDTITACFDQDGDKKCGASEPFATATKIWAGSTDDGGDDGGNGGLPITGRSTGLIAGAGALVLALGLAGYVIVRRRRVRFTAE